MKKKNRTEKSNLFRLLLLTGLMVLAWGCKKNDDQVEKPQPVSPNLFSMEINGRLWQPSILSDDSCYAAYNCAWSAVDNSSFALKKRRGNVDN